MVAFVSDLLSSISMGGLPIIALSYGGMKKKEDQHRAFSLEEQRLDRGNILVVGLMVR